MGGGLASICAIDMQYNFKVAVNAVLFEAPKVGNKAYKISTKKRVDICYTTYGNDIVPMLPFKLLGFYDVGTHLHYGPDRHWYKMNTQDHKIQNLKKVICQ